MTYDEFLVFLDKFKQINSFAGKIKAANENLTRIGMGSGRAVYDIDGEKVLKVARNTKGIAQNQTEAGIGYYHDTQHIVTKIFDSADDDSWLISEMGKKVNERRIKELTGIPSLNDLYMYLRNFIEQNNGKKKMFGQSEEIVELLNENEFAQDLDNFIANYNQSAGDMGRPSSYGEVLRDGQPSIVLTDYGLNDEVYSTHYDPRRKSKQSYRMYELYNFADGNDDILSDAGGGMDIRHGMWAQMPYSVGDGDGVINEKFVNFVSNRNKYPNKLLPSTPQLVDGFHNIVNNLKEVLDNHKDKKGFYKNLLILQDYLIRQKFYDREPLGLEEYNVNESQTLNEVAYDRQTADDIAKEVAEKKGLGTPRYLGSGLFGYAYDMGNDLVLKITSDNSEAFENMELIGKPLKYVAKPYYVYQIKSQSRDLGKTYAIVLEKLRTDDKVFTAKMKRLNYAFEKILDYSLGTVVQTYIYGNNGYVDTDKIDKYLAKNPQDAEFFNDLLNIGKELQRYGVETIDYTNPTNLGYTKNGDVGFFDIGFGNGFLNPEPEQIDLNEFGGDSLYVTPDNMGGSDGFPTYETNDTSPSIQNDLNANSAMYTEDLEYNHASDATQDEYVISEEVIPYPQDGDYDEDEYEFDMEDVGNQAYQLAKRSGINILSDKELSGFVIDNGVVIGAIFAGIDNGNREFSFDVVVDVKHRGTGIGKELTQYGISEYNAYRDMFDGKLKLKLDVVNPYMRDLLKKHFKFKDIKKTDDDRYLMGLKERVMSSMKGSSTVDVKKKCRLAGNGNTSTPCNQGDINNLTIKPLREMNGDDPKDYWAWVSPDNRLIKVGTLKHRGYIMRVYKDAEFGWDYDRVFDQALKDGWVRVIYEYNPRTYGAELSLNGDNEQRVKDVFKKMFADSVKYGRNYIYLEWESPVRNHVKFSTGDEEGKKQLSSLMTEEYLGTIDYEDEDFKDPIEAFKNPKSLKNLKPEVRGVIDSRTGDLYVVNAKEFLHARINDWLNNKFGFNFSTDFYQLYGNPFKIVPVQREGNTNKFKLGELYPSLYHDDDLEKLMPQIQKVLDMAKSKNPTIDFVPEVVPDSDVLLKEDIDASEAHGNEASVNTVMYGKRNVGTYVTYNRKDVIQKLEDYGLNVLPLVDNQYGLVIIFNDMGRENAMNLWKYAKSKGGFLEDTTPEEARFIGKMLEYSDDSVERFVNRIYDENGKRRKLVVEELDSLENSSNFAGEIPVTNSSELMKEETEISNNIMEAKFLM